MSSSTSSTTTTNVSQTVQSVINSVLKVINTVFTDGAQLINGIMNELVQYAPAIGDVVALVTVVGGLMVGLGYVFTRAPLIGTLMNFLNRGLGRFLGA